MNLNLGVYILFLFYFFSNVSLGQGNNTGVKDKAPPSINYLNLKDSLSFDKIDSLYSSQNYTEALDKALLLLKKSKSEKNYLLSSEINNLIGKIYFENHSYLKAIEFYTTSNEYIKKHKQSFISEKKEDFNLLKSSFYNDLEITNLQKIGSAYHVLK